MTTSERLLLEFEHEMASTRKILERVPAEQSAWKPHEKSMSLGRLAGHVAELSGWAVDVLRADSYDINPGQKGLVMESREDVVHKFDGWLRDAKLALAATPDEAYLEVWRLTSQGRTIFEMTRGTVFRSMVMNHMIHHRGQLSVYLRLLGVAIPGCYGPSADEMKGFAASQEEA